MVQPWDSSADVAAIQVHTLFKNVSLDPHALPVTPGPPTDTTPGLGPHAHNLVPPSAALPSVAPPPSPLSPDETGQLLPPPLDILSPEPPLPPPFPDSDAISAPPCPPPLQPHGDTHRLQQPPLPTAHRQQHENSRVPSPPSPEARNL
eukprot:scaffold4038_cov403-Prasinococcus_capsulatus_cf.AAC.3